MVIRDHIRMLLLREKIKRIQLFLYCSYSIKVFGGFNKNNLNKIFKDLE